MGVQGAEGSRASGRALRGAGIFRAQCKTLLSNLPQWSSWGSVTDTRASPLRGSGAD